MNKHMLAVLVGLALGATAAFAQTITKVDQGKPGTQGPWPVTFSSVVWPTDGGAATGVGGTGTFPYPCGATSKQTTYTMDAGAVTVGGTLAARVYSVLCNSADNASGVVRCRADGTAATTTVGSAGTVLAVGSCVLFTNPSGKPITCAGAGSLYVSDFECAP